MRNCHSTAYGRGSQFFTLENLSTDVISIQLEGGCCPVAKLVEQPPLVLCAEVNHRVTRGEEFLDVHRHSIPKLALFLVHISQEIACDNRHRSRSEHSAAARDRSRSSAVVVARIRAGFGHRSNRPIARPAGICGSKPCRHAARGPATAHIPWEI